MNYGFDQQAADQIAQNMASKMTVSGAIAGVVGWLSEINWLGLSAVAISLTGVVASVYFQHRRDKREQRESELRVWEVTRLRQELELLRAKTGEGKVGGCDGQNSDKQ